jgi:hypothetical protein
VTPSGKNYTTGPSLKPTLAHYNIKAGAGDSAAESARWLLETAGIIGDDARYVGGSHFAR